MTEMYDPAHPGEIVREECLSLRLDRDRGGRGVGGHPQGPVRSLERRYGCSPEIAIRLEQVFGSTADTWLRMQMQRNLSGSPAASREDQGQQAVC